MALTDGQLVERVRGGEREAFGDLVGRYRDMVYGLGYHLTHDFEQAKDLAQEAFIQAYLKLGQLRDPEKFSGWLRQIATNAHRDQARRKQVATVALEEAELGADDRQPSGIEAVVRDALTRLREPERLALTLHYVNGYSSAEIGSFLGVRPETVKTRIARARKHLRTEVMAMVEGTFEKKKLPEEFTKEVIARVQAAVAAQNWQAVLEEVERSGLPPEQYPDLGYGVGLARIALGWKPLAPQALSQGADLLLQALESGHGDPEMVWRAVSALEVLGEDARIPPALTRYIEQTQDPGERLKAGIDLVRIWEKLGDEAAALNAHRALLTGLGEQVDYAVKLDSYLYLYTANAYMKNGLALEWLETTLGLWNSAPENVKTLERAERLLSSALMASQESKDSVDQIREWALPYAEELLRDRRLEQGKDRPIELRTKGRIYLDLFRLHLWSGQPEKALEAWGMAKGVAEELARGAEASGDNAWREAAYEIAANTAVFSHYRNLGSRQEALALLRKAEQFAPPVGSSYPVYFYLAALILATGGNRQEALDYLRRVGEAPYSFTGFMQKSFDEDSSFDSVRDDPEFLAVVKSWRETAKGQK